MADWAEEDHPRDANGKFAGAASSGELQKKAKSHIEASRKAEEHRKTLQNRIKATRLKDEGPEEFQKRAADEDVEVFDTGDDAFMGARISIKSATERAEAFKQSASVNKKAAIKIQKALAQMGHVYKYSAIKDLFK